MDAHAKNKKVTLTLNPKLHALLAQKANEKLMSVQEYIYDALRNKLFTPPLKKTGAGRPRKSDDPYLDYFSRNR